MEWQEENWGCWFTYRYMYWLLFTVSNRQEKCKSEEMTNAKFLDTGLQYYDSLHVVIVCVKHISSKCNMSIYVYINNRKHIWTVNTYQCIQSESWGKPYDKLTLLQAITVNQDHLITVAIFVVSSQTLANSIRQYNCWYYNQNLQLHCQ